MSRSVVALACLTAAMMLGVYSCGDEHEQSPRARWESSRPTRYVVQACTMGIHPPGCVRAAIEDGEAVDAEEQIYAGGLGWTSSDMPRDPLDDMFDRVRAGDVDECELEDVVYDEALGFVESYALVCDGSIQGGRSVACFEPDTLDLEVCDAVPEM